VIQVSCLGSTLTAGLIEAERDSVTKELVRYEALD
jgi:hypothetical protein